MLKLFFFYTIFFTGLVPQKMELLSKNLPVHIQINDPSNRNNLEILLQEKLKTNHFSIISKNEMENLITLEVKKNVQRHSREIKQLKNETDMRNLVTDAMGESTPVVQKLSITIISDKFGNSDSCYIEIIKLPASLPKKRIVKPRLYVTDRTLKERDLQKLVSEIMALSTGINEPLQ